MESKNNKEKYLSGKWKHLYRLSVVAGFLVLVCIGVAIDVTTNNSTRVFGTAGAVIAISCVPLVKKFFLNKMEKHNNEQGSN